MNKFFVVIAVVLLASCARIKEEPTPWNTEAVPVVFSVITPDSVVKIYLTNTYTGKEKTKYPLAKASIIDENAHETELTRFDSLFVDKEHLVHIEKGKKYSLKVDLGDGSPVITASTTVPNQAAVFSEYSFIPLDTNEYQNSAYFSCKWSAVKANNPTDTYWLINSWNWDIDPVKNADNTYQAISSRLSYPGKADYYHISLVTTDCWLGKYLLNKRYQNVSITQGMDFTYVIFSEFSGTLPDFSNIENGVGLFGSYLSHTRDLEGNIITN